MAGYWDKIGNLKGADGVGVPTGGQAGQVLHKVGDSDFATAWDHVNYADIEGKVPKGALPDIGNSTVPVDSEAAMLNLPAVVGNMAIRTDIGKTFVLAEEPASVLSNWVELVTASDVVSVNGQTGNVNLTKADIGLGNVNNSADADKPLVNTSRPGLMSHTDKVKLDNATAAATASRLAIRDSAGRISFKQVTLSEAPTTAGHTATKSYVDDGLAGRVKVLGVLGSGVDLNDLKENCVGVQATSVNATAALNYPELTAGAIQVIYSGTSMIYQFYTTYSTSATKIWWRTFYSNSWGAWKQVVDTQMLADGVAAGVKPAEFQLKELQGGQVLTKTIPSGVGWPSGTLSDDWGSLRVLAQTGVVEGFVKGCPAGGTVTDGMSAGFVKDPVWKLEVRPEGLGYATQRAQLLNCVPVYMVGFAWERTYNPVTSKWTGWTCVAGDTGRLEAGLAGASSASPEVPMRYVKSSTTDLYSDTYVAPFLHRIGGDVYFRGTMTSTNSGMTTTGGTNFAEIFTSTATGGGNNLGAEHILIPQGHGGNYNLGVMSGSNGSTWVLQLFEGATKPNIARYTGSTTSGRTWLPFTASWPAPPVNTYTGSGFVVVPPQSGSQDPGN